MVASEMEQWRTFLGKANADIWTVIQQAINLAAVDFPKEFKERRGEIAELLFERRLLQLKELVETNEENLLEEGELRDDGEGLVAGGAQDDLKGHHCADHEAEVLTDEMQRETSMSKEIEHIKEVIAQINQPDNVVFDSLQRLENMQITVDALKATEIGRHVNAFRKHSSKRVRAIVKRLVRQWKYLVDEWVTSAGGDKAAFAASEREYKGLQDDVDMEFRDSSNPVDKGGCLDIRTSSSEPSQLFSFISNEMCGQTGSKEEEHFCTSTLPSAKENIYYPSRSQTGSMLTDSSDKGSASYAWGLRTPEEMWSTTRDIPSSGRVDPLAFQMMNSQCEKDLGETTHVGLSAPKIASNAVGPGRTANDMPKGRFLSGLGNPARGANEPQSSTKLNNSQQVSAPNSSLAFKSLKLSVSNDLASVDKKRMDQKLEIAKRKLQQGYQQAENAKKQRTVQVLDFPDLPKTTELHGKFNLSVQSKQNRRIG